MQPDTPRTITFNPRPDDEAQFRSARLGSYVVGWLLGMPAVICLAVAGVYNLWWAFSIGGSPLEQLMLCLISLAMTGVIGGLPVASVMLAATYPAGARQCWPIWTGALYVSAFSAFYFVCTRDWALPGASEPSTSIGWISAGYLDERQMRALATLIFCLMALAGGGLLLRLAVLASAESWRLGAGQARWSTAAVPTVQAELVQPLAGVTSRDPEEIWDLWARCRLKHLSGKHVQGEVGYRDYAESCRQAGLEPLSMTKWGSLMTKRAEATGGQVVKGKVNGVICYKGWVLVGSDDDVPESGEATVPSLPPRGEAPVLQLGRTR
jgi:hypothetical protein